ncbi:hypothetical protein HDU98_006622, partial [Podochytrium sp. JEL0797]
MFLERIAELGLLTHSPDGLTSEALVGTHVTLCRHILQLFLSAAQQQISQTPPVPTPQLQQSKYHLEFCRETWIVLLKVLLGCADRLLSEPSAVSKSRRGSYADSGGIGVFVAPVNEKSLLSARWGRGVEKERIGTSVGDVNPGPKMGDALCDVLSKVLIEVWLRNIIGNINTIESPENFFIAIKGISRVVDSFLYVGTRKEFHPDINCPDGNTLLHMFGHYLFEAVTRKSPEYEDGISEAFGVLCKIFCTPQPRAAFLGTYLARFYSCMSVALKTGHPQTLTSIIMNCARSDFFMMELAGSRVLVYDFSVALKRVLLATDKAGFPVGIVSMEELRKGCLKIVGGLMGVLNRFGGVGVKAMLVLERSEFTEKIRCCYSYYNVQKSARTSSEVKDLPSDPSSSNPPATFKSLKPYYLDLLLNTLLLEQNSPNLKLTLHLLSCFCVEEIDFCPAAVSLVLEVVKDRMLFKIWNQDVQMCAFDFLAQMSNFWEAIDGAVKGSSKDLVISLCTYIDGLFAEDNVITNQQMIIKAYDGLIRWALIGGWMEPEKDCIARVNASLCRGVTLLDRHHEFSVITGGGGGNNLSSNTTTPASSRPTSNYGSNGNLLGVNTHHLHHHHAPSPLSPNSGLGSLNAGGGGSGGGAEKQNTLANHLAAFAGNVTNAISTNSERSKTRKEVKKTRSNTLSSPLATLVAAVSASTAAATASTDKPSGTPTVTNTNTSSVLLTNSVPFLSTSTATASVPMKHDGISTFAKLTAEGAVKSAAEIALAQLLNHLGNFPPPHCEFGVTRVSTLFNEISEVRRILSIRERLLQNSIFASSRNSVDSEGEGAFNHSATHIHGMGTAVGCAHFKKYLRFFVYDNRILMGFLEQPEWARESGHAVMDEENDESSVDYSLQPRPRDPKLILVLRDATGKFSWVSKLKYLEVLKKVENGGTTAGGGGGKEVPGLVEKPKRPASAPMSGRKPMPVKLKEQQLVPHESEGNIMEAVHSELKDSLGSMGVAETPAPREGIHSGQAAASAEEYSVIPSLPPYIPPNSGVLHGECFDESAIPKFSELLHPDSEEGKKFEQLKQKLEKCIQIENETYNSESDTKLETDISVHPAPPVDRFDVNTPCILFRQFLSHMGYLGLESREKLKPMVMSEAFLKDLERMDALPERECFSVSVLYARDCRTTTEEMILPKKGVTPDFYEFLHSVGWPISLHNHVGYRGNLSPTFCKTTSYFATRNVEMLFNCPYTLKAVEDVDFGIRRGSSVVPPPKQQEPVTEMDRLKQLFMNCNADNQITVLWIENLIDVHNVVKRVTSQLTPNTSCVIVVHPQTVAASNSVYDIKIFTASGVVDENLTIGPLADGMVVSKGSLGNLVRMTAQSAHLFARAMKSGYRRPQTARRLMIEEIGNRHKGATTMAA